MKEICDSCGIEKIGGVCLTKWCENRDESVDQMLEEVV